MGRVVGPGLTRREVLAGGAALLAAGGALLTASPARAGFKDVHAAMKSVLGDAQPRTGRVSLKLPKIVEDGSSVPIEVSVDSPMTPDNHVKRVHIFPEKNPTPFAATFHLGPQCGKANISTRIRLAESQKVIAVAELSDGSVWMTATDVVVTVGGCGGVVVDTEAERPEPRIRVLKKAARGKVIQIKTMITHPMESGQRVDTAGNPVPRKIINRFVCLYGDEEVFSADFRPSIAPNPPVFFYLVATRSGPLTFKWIDDDGSVYTGSAVIEVT